MVRSNSESEPATTDRRGNDADLYVRVRASSAPRETRTGTRLRYVGDIACRSVTSSARSRSRSRPSAEREAGLGGCHHGSEPPMTHTKDTRVLRRAHEAHAARAR